MKKPGSLLWRLALTIGLVVAAAWIATAFMTARILDNEIGEVFDGALQATAQRILPLAVTDIMSREEEGVNQRIAALTGNEEYLVYVVRDDLGRTLLRSQNADTVDFPAFDGIGFRMTPTHRIYQDAAVQGTITISVAEPLEHRREVAHDTIMALALPLIGLLPLSLVAIWVLVRTTLSPVRRFSASIETRGSGDLSPLGAGDLPQEIVPVATAVDSLLERVRRALDAERSFTANAAHELRTPVAAALAQTQRLIAETGEDTAKRRAVEIETSLKRLNRLSEKLMQLARAESGRMRSPAPYDIREVIRLTVQDAGAQREGNPVRLSLPGMPVMADIDPDALSIVCRNLIENAIKHRSGEGRVDVALSREGTLHVVNESPVVAPEVLEAIVRQFERGQTMAEGSGLGLSIVQAVAVGAEGGFDIRSPARGREDGFEAIFRVAMPASPTVGKS
ncbi:MAG: sensor histidine kinase N-terminal domain-containing protein [Rhodobiaceae bacterium]|nr:sensor histidine kinase N-terminal domain-containing protein [Rhodobiaceae bacterium]MCC0054978.1 sensor histidine kinase N-terminal domain-containing protein [Rhodobiaceae bacterium]